MPSARTRSSTSTDGLVEHLRLDDRLAKICGPRLVADLERVTETPGDREGACGRPCARGAHWSRPSSPSSPRRCAPRGSAGRAGVHQPADPGDRRVAIGAGVFGQEFCRRRCDRPDRAPTMSVNVPPRSIQKSHLPAGIDAPRLFSHAAADGGRGKFPRASSKRYRCHFASAVSRVPRLRACEEECWTKVSAPFEARAFARAPQDEEGGGLHQAR